MTVAELIAQLRTLPQDLKVYTFDTEFNEAQPIRWGAELQDAAYTIQESYTWEPVKVRIGDTMHAAQLPKITRTRIYTKGVVIQ